ncbi:unnamed protein product [Tetraodon nigroviridis]|uniref:(spotted green pufferfish) hypothetical protein n=1 Tax=Tetraodon nigroviridis TaxID=99883 RepID=Q4RHC7_TETNG|nr:unnamed protein product [Tetraodon nigroviridis]
MKVQARHTLDKNAPTYRAVNTGQPRWSTCLGRASPRDPISGTRINIQSHAQNILSGVWLERTRRMSTTAASRIGAMLYWCDYITPAPISLSPEWDNVSGTLGTQTGPCAPISCLPK